MTWYSNGPRDRIFVKDYGYFSIGRNIRKMFCENISKSLSWRYSSRLFDHTKEFVTNEHKGAESN